MTSDEFIKVEKFANGLKECYTSRLKDHVNEDDSLNKMIVSTLHYALSVLDLHLNMARIEFEQSAMEQERAIR